MCQESDLSLLSENRSSPKSACPSKCSSTIINTVILFINEKLEWKFRGFSGRAAHYPQGGPWAAYVFPDAQGLCEPFVNADYWLAWQKSDGLFLFGDSLSFLGNSGKGPLLGNSAKGPATKPVSLHSLSPMSLQPQGLLWRRCCWTTKLKSCARGAQEEGAPLLCTSTGALSVLHLCWPVSAQVISFRGQQAMSGEHEKNWVPI